jgi:hypothetical protein
MVEVLEEMCKGMIWGELYAHVVFRNLVELSMGFPSLFWVELFVF